MDDKLKNWDSNLILTRCIWFIVFSNSSKHDLPNTALYEALNNMLTLLIIHLLLANSPCCEWSGCGYDITSTLKPADLFKLRKTLLFCDYGCTVYCISVVIRLFLSYPE